MPDLRGDQEPVYDATLGNPSPIDARQGSDPDAGRVRVLLNGALAQGPLAATLATELETLIAGALNPASPPIAPGPPDEVEVSLHGLGLARELEEEIIGQIRAHIDARLGAVPHGRDDATQVPPEGDR